MDKKIELENKNINKTFKEVEVKDLTLRGDFLTNIYNILLKNNIIEESKTNPIDALKDLGIVKGNGKDLYLDKNITPQEAVVLTKRATDIAFEKLDAGSKGVIWEVDNKGNKVYLLGSIHMADSSIYPYSKDLMDKFNSSDELYVEVDISDTKKTEAATIKMMEDMTKKMQYADGKKLKDVIGDELYSQLKAVMDKNEVPETAYESSKPWAVIQQINAFSAINDMVESKEASGDKNIKEEEELTEAELEKLKVDFENMENPADFGIDMYLLNKAKETNKPVKELETIESQMKVLFEALGSNPNEKLSEEDQIKTLKESLENLDNPDKKKENAKKLELDMEQLTKSMQEQQDMIKGMLESWKVGDVKRLKEILSSEGSDPTNIMAVLLGERDKAMSEKIAKLLEGEDKKQYFVVVGAAHYVTDGMVVDMLKDKGYEVKSLN